MWKPTHSRHLDIVENNLLAEKHVIGGAEPGQLLRSELVAKSSGGINIVCNYYFLNH